MRIALLSDIHANLEALTACLAHANAQGADGHALLGDFVGYGADAVAVVDVVMDAAARGAIAVQGNHDAAIAAPQGYFNDHAREALAWARGTLRDDQRQFLADLPLRVERAPAMYVHASTHAPERWDYIDSPGAAQRATGATGQVYTFCGHVHDQQLYFATPGGKMSVFTPVPGVPIPAKGARQWLAVVGSVGQPRDRNPAAAYALFDDVRREITFFRVPYDHRAAAAKIRAAGLPEALAYRVEAGT